MSSIRRSLIRLAHNLPQGSDERVKVLGLLKSSSAKPGTMAEAIQGYLWDVANEVAKKSPSGAGRGTAENLGEVKASVYGRGPQTGEWHFNLDFDGKSIRIEGSAEKARRKYTNKGSIMRDFKHSLASDMVAWLEDVADGNA